MIGTPVDANNNPIQIDCDFTQCCFTDSIVAFRTARNQQDTDCGGPLEIGGFPGGQCRRLTICLTGFGIEVECADASCAPRALTPPTNCCSVPCGGTLNVKVTATGGSAPTCTTPLVLSVHRPTDPDGTFTTITLNASGCYVDTSPVPGTYIFRATDCNNCSREDTLLVCVETATGQLTVSGNTGCNTGVLTFTASAADSNGNPLTGCLFEFFVGTQSQGPPSTTNTFTYNPCSGAGGVSTACRSVSVKITGCAGGCVVANQPTITFSQCVNTTLGCTPPTP
jgi:hypothetical protein